MNYLDFQQMVRWHDAFWLMAALLLVSLWFSGERGAIATRPDGFTRFESRVRVALTLVAFAAGSVLWFSVQNVLPGQHPLDVLPLQINLPPGVRAQWVMTYTGAETPAYFMLLAGSLTALLVTYRRRLAFLALLLSAAVALIMTGLGQHWPLTLLLGWSTGFLFGAFFLLLQAGLKTLLMPINTLETRPAQIYPVLFLLLIDMVYGFPLVAWLSRRVSEAF
jgi:hypothetical protein